MNSWIHFRYMIRFILWLWNYHFRNKLIIIGYRLISTQQSIPTNSTSAPVSPLTSKESFPNVPQHKSIEERGTERPWKHTQKQHHRSHTVKHHKKREDDIQSTSQHTSLISGPTGFKKADPEELYRQLINGKHESDFFACRHYYLCICFVVSTSLCIPSNVYTANKSDIYV